MKYFGITNSRLYNIYSHARIGTFRKVVYIKVLLEKLQYIHLLYTQGLDMRCSTI
jgi:hypothetical protein